MNETLPTAQDDVVTSRPDGGWRDLYLRDDWLSIWLGAFLLAFIAHFVWHAQGTNFPREAEDIQLLKRSLASAPPGLTALQIESMRQEIETREKKVTSELTKPFKGWVVKPQKWTSSPLESVYSDGKKPYNLLPGMLVVGAGLWMVLAIGSRLRGIPILSFSIAYIGLYVLAVVAYMLANQDLIRYYNLEYPLWGLLVGLSISNFIGTPKWLQPSVQTEFYIKTGLVLLGCEVLFSQLLQLGLPGICISWITTPIVLIGTFLFGQYVLRIESRTLNIVIAADMSVCGVSAAIATAAACRAKRSELSLAIGLSLGFTVIMMVVMPMIIVGTGMDPVLGGAWIGGTIDATGAVAAAGASLGKTGLFVATTVKMIQNILIGAIAFGVAVYWAAVVEKQGDNSQSEPGTASGKSAGARTVGPGEIWRRFPKFVLGFILASIVFSYLYKASPSGQYLVDAVKEVEKTIREWLFCLAFVSIGLESNLKEFRDQLKDGKALTLYVVGQAFNLILTLFMAWLMFSIVFPDLTSRLR